MCSLWASRSRGATIIVRTPLSVSVATAHRGQKEGQDRVVQPGKRGAFSPGSAEEEEVKDGGGEDTGTACARSYTPPPPPLPSPPPPPPSPSAASFFSSASMLRQPHEAFGIEPKPLNTAAIFPAAEHHVKRTKAAVERTVSRRGLKGHGWDYSTTLGGQGFPHGTPGPASGGSSRGANKNLSSASLGDSRWEVSRGTQETGGDVSLRRSAERRCTRGVFGKHVYIHVLQNKYGSVKIYIPESDTDKKQNTVTHVWHTDTFPASNHL
ncbi:hypothetical protein Q5P01_013784 [Channa striata]|uniref:Uncharacterized protein n=1 Tax=Channa striata TaxID=64152 RepID=A0AA88SKR3_CHASR|nr:hypothetical protein Q5P01_013784 [Channa striata]